jgi:hypothetical protein
MFDFVMNLITWVLIFVGVCGVGLMFWFVVWTWGDGK